jgi:hypothetical protein
LANSNAISSVQSSGALSASLTTAAQNIAPSEITILIKSNRSYVQGFNAMGSKFNGNDNANANQEYRYNFTGYVFNTSNSTLTIQVKGVGASQFTTFSTPFNGNTVQSVAQTLNTLSIGIFSTYTDLGQTYVSTHNDDNVYGNLTISSTVVSVQQIIETESGDPLTTENNDIITTEVANTTIFPVEYIPQGDPSLTITVQDSGAGGGGGTTYEQVRNAFSQNNYEVQGMYLFSPDIQQLTNIIQYNSLDVNGNKQILNIANTIDPNQLVTSSIVDLSQFDGNVVFNGNSFISSNILPFNTLQMKFLATNINTNSELPNNFLDMERITNTKFFEPQVGDMSIFERNEAFILNQIPVEVNPANKLEKFKAKIRDNISNQNQQPIAQNEQSIGQKQKLSKQSIKKSKEKLSTEKPINLLNNKYTPIVLLGVATLVSIYFYTKKKNE